MREVLLWKKHKFINCKIEFSQQNLWSKVLNVSKHDVTLHNGQSNGISLYIIDTLQEISTKETFLYWYAIQQKLILATTTVRPQPTIGSELRRLMNPISPEFVTVTLHTSVYLPCTDVFNNVAPISSHMFVRWLACLHVCLIACSSACLSSSFNSWTTAARGLTVISVFALPGNLPSLNDSYRSIKFEKSCTHLKMHEILLIYYTGQIFSLHPSATSPKNESFQKIRACIVTS